MSRKLVHTAMPRTNRAGQTVGAKVYFLSEWEEFEVVPMVDGKPHTPGTYHTGDRDDAEATAAAIVCSMSCR